MNTQLQNTIKVTSNPNQKPLVDLCDPDICVVMKVDPVVTPVFAKHVVKYVQDVLYSRIMGIPTTKVHKAFANEMLKYGGLHHKLPTKDMPYAITMRRSPQDFPIKGTRITLMEIAAHKYLHDVLSEITAKDVYGDILDYITFEKVMKLFQERVSKSVLQIEVFDEPSKRPGVQLFPFRVDYHLPGNVQKHSVFFHFDEFGNVTTSAADEGDNSMLVHNQDWLPEF